MVGKLEGYISQVETGLYFAEGEQAYVLLDLHRPKDALAMVRATYDETRATVPHQIRGWLRAAEAEMAAAAGLENTCRQALDSAAAEIGHGPSDLPYLALNETHLTRWRGNCLVTFGDQLSNWLQSESMST